MRPVSACPPPPFSSNKVRSACPPPPFSSNKLRRNAAVADAFLSGGHHPLDYIGVSLPLMRIVRSRCTRGGEVRQLLVPPNLEEIQHAVKLVDEPPLGQQHEPVVGAALSAHHGPLEPGGRAH